MTILRTLLICIAFASVTLTDSVPGFADDDRGHAKDHNHSKDHEHSDSTASKKKRNKAPHVHGHAKIGIALEGEKVEFKLESPADNILGFEHQPKTQAQKDAVTAAQKKLQSLDHVMSLNSEANCSLQDTIRVSSELISETPNHKHEHHEKESHSEFHIEGKLTCKAPEALKHIHFHLFKSFDRLQKLEVIFLRGSEQKKKTLTPREPHLTL